MRGVSVGPSVSSGVSGMNAAYAANAGISNSHKAGSGGIIIPKRSSSTFLMAQNGTDRYSYSYGQTLPTSSYPVTAAYSNFGHQQETYRQHQQNEQRAATPPSALFTYPSSRTLDYTALNLTSLPPLILIHHNLTSLYLPNNKLETVPGSLLSSCPNLKVLDLSFNELTALPGDALKNLKWLKELYLSSNNLKGFPSLSASVGSSGAVGVLEGLENVEVLDLSANNLSVLPDEGWNRLRSLEVLVLSQNPDLTALPASLGGLRDKRWSSVSSSLGGSSGGSLKYLLLDGCRGWEDTGLQKLVEPLEGSNRLVAPRVLKSIEARRALKGAEENGKASFVENADGGLFSRLDVDGGVGVRKVQFGGKFFFDFCFVVLLACVTKPFRLTSKMSMPWTLPRCVTCTQAFWPPWILIILNLSAKDPLCLKVWRTVQHLRPNPTLSLPRLALVYRDEFLTTPYNIPLLKKALPMKTPHM
jgi:hypothetical protein